jgi:LPS sulfotransferase NodH
LSWHVGRCLATERRFSRFRQSAAAAAVTFLDVAYTDLVADPIAALSRMYAAAGLELPADPAAMVERYEDDQPRHARGVHRYTAAQFGLDERGLVSASRPSRVDGAERVSVT